jgi:nitrite reductase (NADH) small subunit
MTDTLDEEMTAPRSENQWTEVCSVHDVQPDRGVAALVVTAEGTTPVAVFRLSAVGDTGDEWYGVGHVDPATGAPVMARGLVGSAGEPPVTVATVASPLHKQRYNLRTGQCLDDDSLRLDVFDVRIDDDRVWVRPA